MTRIRDIKTTFTAGQVSRDLLGRGDLRAYDNGALMLKNVFINPTGGVKRRFGMRYIDNAPGLGKLIAFEFNSEQTALLVITDGQIDIYSSGVKETTITTPWNAGQIDQIAWTQSADTLLLVHPETPPKKLVRSLGGIWVLSDWEYFTQDDIIFQPFFKFADSAVTLRPSETQGAITITASSDVFEAGHEGTRLRLRGIDIDVTDFVSPTVVNANVIPKINPDYDPNITGSEQILYLPDTKPSIDWLEQAFSPVRGYPSTVAFHQDRLVIGGSRDLPNRLWFSKSGDLFNFDLGTGLDDEAIEFSILSDQVNAVRGVFSSRHLQVFTSGAEWMVTGEPLTPSQVQIRRQTRIGSRIDRYIPPLNVDGATLYCARSGNEIYEFLYTDLEAAYASTDLALLSRDIVGVPIDQDYDAKNRLLFVVREDGKFATLTVFRAEKVSAWTSHETNGLVKSVAVVGDDVYMLIERDSNYLIEQLDSAFYLDSALSGQVGSPATTWSGLDHLEGQSVSIIADGAVMQNQVVQNGSVTLSEAVSSVQIGLSYTHVIEPLPPNEVGRIGAGRKIRLIEAIFRLKESAALRVDVGRGLKDIPLKDFDNNIISDQPNPLISGDVRVRAIGWQKEGSSALWRIEQELPLAFTLLSVATEIKVND